MKLKEALEVSTTLERRITEADRHIYQTLIALGRFLEKTIIFDQSEASGL